MKSDYMIKAENMFFSYTGSAPYVLSQINFDIKTGEYVSVIGENGSGKSTLIKLILGFLRPVKGNVFSAASKTGYVPQKSDSFNSDFPITVLEAMDSYRRLLRIKDKDVIYKALEKTGMASHTGDMMRTLSGGQNQKVLIARALMGSPDLLILDEPSAGIDMKSQKEIYSFLKKANQNEGITIISVEHNLDAAISNSTLIYHLLRGEGHFCLPERYASEYLKADRQEGGSGC